MLYNLASLITFSLLSNAAVLNKDAKVHSFDLNKSNIEKRSVGDANVFDHYRINFQVGSNKDLVTLIFDSGLYLTHILDSDVNCTNPTCKAKGTFDSKKSTTLVRTGQNESTLYGYGNTELAGERVYDDVTISDLTIKNFTFVDTNYAKVYVNGIFGAGIPQNKEESVAWAAYKEGLINKPIHSFYLGDKNIQGKFHLGGYDKAKLDGDFVWSEVGDGGISRAQTQYMIINGTKINSLALKNVDTGNLRGDLSDPTYSQVIDALSQEGAYNKQTNKYNCSALEGKSFILSIGGKELSLPLKSFVQPDQTGQNCNPSVYKGYGLGLLGAYFFRYAMVAFDFENNLIGFGQFKNTTATNIVPF